MPKHSSINGPKSDIEPETDSLGSAVTGGYPFNDEFMSNDSEEVAGFYNHFHSRDELVEWMKGRPHGHADLSEVDGRNDVIVVIPTSDAHGPLSINCRTQLFKGQHIIFVDSKGLDPLFNYARNVNIGVRRALELDPRWVVVANDDCIRIDPISTLVSRLETLRPEETTIVYPMPYSGYHSVKASLVCLRDWAYPILRLKRAEIRETYDLLRRFGVKYEFMSDSLFKAGVRRWLYGPLFRAIASYVDTVSFGVYSSQLIHDLGGKLFDEGYVNQGEESDLAFRIWTRGKGIQYVPFQVGDQVGLTLGTGPARTLRGVAGAAYLNYRIEHGFLKVPRIEGGRAN
ncbi:MAG TPA: hypothetical protein VGG32_00130 [Thermoplasmata archaeon]